MSFLKNLIFEDKEEKKPKKEGKSFPKKKVPKNAFEGTKPSAFIADEVGRFPSTSSGDNGTPTWTATPVQTTTNLDSCDPHIDSVMALYEKGFDSLNQDGYDFYEYYKAVLEAGVDNPAIYKMALTMAKAMDPSVSKQSLLSQSDFYVTEIEKVHKSYNDNGLQKKASISTSKSQENQRLVNDLEDVKRQLSTLEQKKLSIESQLNSIDGKYAPQLHDVSCKIEANDFAKNKIIESINKVKQGINSNI